MFPFFKYTNSEIINHKAGKPMFKVIKERQVSDNNFRLWKVKVTKGIISPTKTT